MEELNYTARRMSEASHEGGRISWQEEKGEGRALSPATKTPEMGSDSLLYHTSARQGK